MPRSKPVKRTPRTPMPDPNDRQSRFDAWEGRTIHLAGRAFRGYIDLQREDASGRIVVTITSAAITTPAELREIEFTVSSADALQEIAEMLAAARALAVDRGVLPKSEVPRLRATLETDAEGYKQLRISGSKVLSDDAGYSVNGRHGDICIGVHSPDVIPALIAALATVETVAL